MKIISLFVLLTIPLYSFAQSDVDSTAKNGALEHISLQGLYQNGYVFNTNQFTNGHNVHSSVINSFQTFSFKVSTQKTGAREWERLYKYPYWGVGVYVADFHDPQEIGYPIALYGFLNAPFVRSAKFSFNYELSFGATFNWKSYNPVTNQYNIAIGAGQSFFIDAGLNMQIYLAKRIDLETGFSLTHFSNGALKRPNNGLNTIAPKIGLRYNFYDRPQFVEKKAPKYSANNEWDITVFGGMKNIIYDSVNINIMEKYEGIFFPVFGVSGIFNRQISHKSKIGIGVGVNYDGSVNAQLAVDRNELEAIAGPFMDHIQVSIFPSYELVVNKISLILQPAFYLYRKNIKNQTPAFHQRIGVKYHINENIYIGISLRDYAFHVSDFIEWNIGYRIKRR